MFKSVEIRDCVHGHIHIDHPLIKQIIDKIEFQRLRNILQLGFVNQVYPTANHTRFEHSLGTYEVASIWLNHLRGDLEITPRECLLVQIAALVHDLGHCSFSHSFDHSILPHLAQYKEFGHFAHHEYRSTLLFRHMCKKYSFEITQKEQDIICEMIWSTGQSLDSPFNYLKDIVSNNTSFLDSDRLDYLLRDSFYTGMPCSINIRELLQKTRIIITGKETKIAYSIKISEQLPLLFEFRKSMFRRVYCYPPILLIEYHVCKKLVECLSKRDSFIGDLISEDCKWAYSHDFIDIVKLLYLKEWNREDVRKELSYTFSEDGEMVRERSEDKKLIENRSLTLGLFPEKIERQTLDFYTFDGKVIQKVFKNSTVKYNLRIFK